MPLLDAYQEWYCPACKQTDRTLPVRANASRMHRCRALRNIIAPMVRAGVKAHLRANERQDYVRDEIVRKDDSGKPVMSVEVMRENGNDVYAFAPLARGTRVKHD